MAYDAILQVCQASYQIVSSLGKTRQVSKLAAKGCESLSFCVSSLNLVLFCLKRHECSHEYYTWLVFSVFFMTLLSSSSDTLVWAEFCIPAQECSAQFVRRNSDLVATRSDLVKTMSVGMRNIATVSKTMIRSITSSMLVKSMIWGH